MIGILSQAVTIRAAEPADVRAVLELMRQLAEHEGLLQLFALTAESLRSACFDPPQRVQLIVAEAENAIVGYASCMVQFSPWAARDYLFLDDLYVADTTRGRGVGSLLMRQVGEVAIELGIDVRWHIETENRSAQKFYQGLGAEVRERFIAYWSLETIRAEIVRVGEVSDSRAGG
ncbi:MAG: acetyltransferase [Acidobacteria bacterium]|nr:acetyltransferase [Acidobacteriota bacterium]